MDFTLGMRWNAFWLVGGYRSTARQLPSLTPALCSCQSIVWNTTIDIPYSTHHSSISDTDPLYSALGAAFTLLSSSGFFSGIKIAHLAHQPILVSSSLQHD